MTLFLDWPAPGAEGATRDLSPTGMRCETTIPLDPHDVVKIASDRFEAVGCVAHVRREPDRTDAGMRFLTVRFPRLLGNFTELQA